MYCTDYSPILDKSKHIVIDSWHIRLNVRLANRIRFGTEGLRAVMRAGFDSMNDLVVIQ